MAYKLMPAATPPMYAHPSSSHGRRGIFAAKHLWVTPHSEEERWPAGMFPLQGPGEYARGILDWTRQVCLSHLMSYCTADLWQIAVIAVIEADANNVYP